MQQNLKRRKAGGVMLAMVCALLMPAVATAGDASDQTLSPYFYVQDPAVRLDHFPLKQTRVHVRISGVVAAVRVVQVYQNTGDRAINGRYIFPAATRASVHGMTMTVGSERIRAELREKKEAEKTFRAAKKAGKSASLLKQKRPNVFSMAVAHIMPGDTITMALDYSEFLVPADGVYSFVYPAVVGPRCSDIPESEADRWIQSPYLPEGAAAATEFDFTAEIAGAMPLKEIQSPSHAISIAWQNAANARVSLSPSAVFGGSRDMILNYRLAGSQIESGLLLYDGAAENFFALMVEPPKRFSPDAVPAREYMFVVDVSGSMHGFPLDTAKTLLKNLLTGLRPQDRFNVMLFAASARKMAPAPVAAAPERVQQALRLIDRQQGGGGTKLAGAMAKALAPSGDAGFSRSIVIVTDGYIAAEKEVFSLISDNLNAANVFAFGIGGSVNRYLIEGMAKAGQGEPFVVTEAAAAPAAAERFRKYVASPLLTDIRVDWEGFAAYAVEPPAIPDLFAGRPVVVFGKWRGTAEGRIRLRGKTGRGAYERVLDVSKTPPQADNRPLRYLWARKRSARLSDYNTKNAGRANKAAVTKLGLAYNLLTPYTAFVAVHERVRNPGGHAADVDQPLPLPRGVSHLAVGEPVGQALARVPEPAIWQVLAGAALLIFGAGLLRRLWRRFRVFSRDL